MTTGGRIRWAAAWLALTGGVGAGACIDNSISTDRSFGTEIEACRECQNILVECSSTSQNEAQFVECRDQWLSCQRGRAIGPDECRNPHDKLACGLCRDRLEACKDDADAAICEEQFGLCKSFLISRGDVAEECTVNGSVPPEVACGVCRKDHAKCLSDASGQNTPEMCGAKFADCLATNQIGADICAPVSDVEACELCEEVQDGCTAAGGPECVADYDACAAALAPGFSCPTDQGTGGGGGGPSTDSCTHDVCVYGAALENGCNACASEVCAQDSYCCNTAAGMWDTFCLNIAATLPSCGCDGPTDTCAHPVCEYGDPLVNGCNDCVTQVCTEDPWCCSNKWDTLCVGYAEDLPACGC
jgi:hypothetical protein